MSDTVADTVTDRDVVIFYADLMGTLKKATARYAYIGDMRYTFSFNGDIIAVHRSTQVGSYRDLDTREDAG